MRIVGRDCGCANEGCIDAPVRPGLKLSHGWLAD